MAAVTFEAVTTFLDKVRDVVASRNRCVASREFRLEEQNAELEKAGVALRSTKAAQSC